MATQDARDMRDAEDAFREGDRRRVFWREHFKALLAKYRDSFIAVKDGEVVAVDPDLFGLLDAVKARGWKPTDVWIEFMTDDPEQVLP